MIAKAIRLFPVVAALLLGACATETVSKSRPAAPVTEENPPVKAHFVFNAPAPKVWEVLSTTRYVEQWWGPHGFKARIRKHDFKVGGRFMFGMEGEGFPLSWNVGTYTQIVPNRKIVMRTTFADDKGRSVPAEKLGMPGQWDPVQTTTIELREEGGRTHASLVQTGVPPEMSQPATMGWVQQFDKIEKLLTP